MSKPLRLGTRGSPLALYQANAVARLLQAQAGIVCEIVTIKTSGDHLGEVSLADIGGKRLFVKEIEDALLASHIHLAVHSSKDLPVVLPDGLEIAGVLPREDARDALVLPLAERGAIDLEHARAALGSAPRVGTSSVRRTAQLLTLLPGATFLPIRGNLDTRLRKLDTGDYDALVLAAAGLRRLERDDRISTALPVEVCVPAPGQGIIAIEARQGDHHLAEVVSAINDPHAATALRAERAVIDRLGGGCQMPVGAFADVVSGEELSLTSAVISLDGSRVAKAHMAGPLEAPEQLGSRVAEQLLARGADRILADAQRTLSATHGHQP